MKSRTLSEELTKRGFVHQFSSEKLSDITDGEKRTIYLGVDPSADSIHAGNFAVYMLLRIFKEYGHNVILLIGGGTGMIGDPKPDVERPLTPPEIVAERAKKLGAQASKILGSSIEIVNNHDWLSKLYLIDFLREIGKHFTVNNLMKKDAISKRLESEEGITYTEFAYPLLQGYDFWHLFRAKNCSVQVSGSDQWGNIMAGVELIRRKENKTAYALTIPLITDKATGKKFGKSEGNAVWLDSEKTSPYEFYQFWLNTSDANVENYLKIFTPISLEEIAAQIESHNANTQEKIAQKMLARSVTSLIHGESSVTNAEMVSAVLFGEKELEKLSTEEIVFLRANAPSFTAESGKKIVDILVESGLAISKREAREFVENGAISLDEVKIKDTEYILHENDFSNGVAVLRRGKRNAKLIVKSR